MNSTRFSQRARGAFCALTMMAVSACAPSAQAQNSPTVSAASVAQAEGDSGTTNFAFVVSLSQASTSTVSVAYATSDGNAHAPTDYIAKRGTLTFAPGVTTQTVNVAVVGNTVTEPLKQFFFNLSNPVNATVLAAQAQAQGNILNDDGGVLVVNLGGSTRDNTATMTESASTTNARSPLIAPAGIVTSNGTSTNSVYSMTVQISNPLDGSRESLTANTSNTTITTNGYDPTTGQLYLRGGESAANFQRVLRTVRYRNSSNNPNTTPRRITVTIDDSSGNISQVATTTVTVIATNTVPVVVVPTDNNGASVPQTVRGNASFTLSSANSNQVGVGDADANGGTEEVSLSVSHGTLSLNGTGGLTFSQGTGVGDRAMTFRGTDDFATDSQGNPVALSGTINSALNGLIYTPDADYVGGDTLSISVNDLGNTGAGGPLSASNTLVLNVVRPPATSGALISQFRLSGPSGSNDEYIELYNNTNTPLNIGGWQLQAGGSTQTFGTSTTIPGRGHLLITGTAYSLSAYSASDIASTLGDVALTTPLSLLNASGATVDTVNSDGTLAPDGTAVTSTDQYALVRRFESGVPNGVFNLVSIARSATNSDVTGLAPFVNTGRLGAPGPRNLNSPIQRNNVAPLTNPVGITNETAKYSSASTNYNSAAASLSSGGQLSMRRTLTNNTGGTATRLRFRIAAITAGSGAGAGIADLRAISSKAALLTVPGGITLNGLFLEAPSVVAGQGGGLNSSWNTVDLTSNPLTLTDGTTATGGLPAGKAANLEFLFAINNPQGGNYRVLIDAELLP